MDKIDVNKCRFRDKFYGTCKATKDGDGECEIPCFDYKNCYYKQLQQLKAENKELKKENQEMYKMGCENFVAIDQAKRLYKLNKCLDEIKEYCKEQNLKYDTTACDILRIIEGIKGNG